MRAGQDVAAEPEQGVEHLAGGRSAANGVAEIDDAVAQLETGPQRVVQPRQTLRLAVNRADRPDAPRRVQDREFLPIHHLPAEHLLVGPPRLVGARTVRIEPGAPGPPDAGPNRDFTPR